jgi:hypothetical protein
MYILIFYFSDLSHIKGKMKMDFNRSWLYSFLKINSKMTVYNHIKEKYFTLEKKC